MAGSVRVWLNQIIKRAKSINATSITWEFYEGTQSACREILGPMMVPGLKFYEVIRTSEAGTAFFVPPYPPDRVPEKREVKVYPITPKASERVEYTPEPAQAPIPAPKKGKGVQVDPQQPVPTEENNLFAEGKVTKIKG